MGASPTAQWTPQQVLTLAPISTPFEKCEPGGILLWGPKENNEKKMSLVIWWAGQKFSRSGALIILWDRRSGAGDVGAVVVEVDSGNMPKSSSSTRAILNLVVIGGELDSPTQDFGVFDLAPLCAPSYMDIRVQPEMLAIYLAAPLLRLYRGQGQLREDSAQEESAPEEQRSAGEPSAPAIHQTEVEVCRRCRIRPRVYCQRLSFEELLERMCWCRLTRESVRHLYQHAIYSCRTWDNLIPSRFNY
ncbi:uncharacterized protein [Scyliorhinus torazame]|uniref:uncharacterized protein isoform X2 n=1 Tax=Scyliorhinus torazame TaxID=75743 RepID=UPI003B5A4D04